MSKAIALVSTGAAWAFAVAAGVQGHDGVAAACAVIVCGITAHQAFVAPRTPRTASWCRRCVLMLTPKQLSGFVLDRHACERCGHVRDCAFVEREAPDPSLRTW